MSLSQAINRRKALTLVASVPAAIALASTTLAHASEDAELLVHGERCKALALEARRLGKLFQKAADQTEKAFYAMKPERWVCGGYLGSGAVTRDADAWWVRAVDGAPSWFASGLDTDEPERLPSKWIRLKASSEEKAKEEARVLDRTLDRDFWEKRKLAGVLFNRDAHYRNWSRSHSELRRAVARLARLKATTLEGLNMKATVLAVAHDAFDEPDIWNEPLQKSLSRDIRRMAA